MLYSGVIKVIALKLLLYTESVCHLKDLGEMPVNNWTDIQQTVEKRIIGGTSTTLKNYPFMVQFYNSGGLCGGSILTSKTVLTAAHCLDHSRNLAMMKIFSNPRFTFDIHAQIHEVWHFTIHEHYNKRAIFANDIAIIIIHDEFIFGPQVQKATIIDTDIWMQEREVFIATGWGETKYGEGLKITDLKMTHLHFISNIRCMKEYHMMVGPEMFCLYGHGQTDTCRGDSGGGVLWNGAVVGIVSHGRKCAQFPGIYINVYFFKSWIRQTVKTLYKLFCDFHNIKV